MSTIVELSAKELAGLRSRKSRPRPHCQTASVKRGVGPAACRRGLTRLQHYAQLLRALGTEEKKPEAILV
jgi:hypothetical protein